MQDGTVASGSELKTLTRLALWARSLGGRVSSKDLGEVTAADFLIGVDAAFPPAFEYFQITRCRPLTNQAHPLLDKLTLHCDFPG